MTIGSDRFAVGTSYIVVSVNASPGPLVGGAASKLRIGGHKKVVIGRRAKLASLGNICTKNSTMANTTAIVDTVNTNGTTTGSVSRCLGGLWGFSHRVVSNRFFTWF